jgi:hypothetical protein
MAPTTTTLPMQCVVDAECFSDCEHCVEGRCQSACGLPLSSAAPGTVTDVLFVLRSSVGLLFCEGCVCDVNDDGQVTVVDALTLLNHVVGIDVNLQCPFPDAFLYGTSTTLMPYEFTTTSTTLAY